MSSLKGEVMADEKVEKSIVSVPVEIEEIKGIGYFIIQQSLYFSY